MPGQRLRRPPTLKSQEEPCAICGGTGFYLLDVAVGHPEFGQPQPCNCRQDQRVRSQNDLMRRISSLGALERLTFESFNPEPVWLAGDKARNLRLAHERCLQYATEPEGWLVLTGSYGCGKTHLAAAIANQRLALGQEVLFVLVPDLLDHLRATFGPHSAVRFDELFEHVRTTPLLVLDDLGSQSGSPWAQEKLFQLLNHRYNAQLPTVITTNQRLEELDQRLRSRLFDITLVHQTPILAPDYRSGANPNQSELSTLGLHRRQHFDTFDTRRQDLSAAGRANLQNVLNAAENFARSPRGWLVLTGAYGCGKTHLAAAIANEQVAMGQTEVMFVVAPDLLDHLRAAFSPQSTMPYDQRFDELRKAPLLVLDDLGTESATPWAREKLFQLLNYRYEAMLPTVITTSVGPNEIEPWLRTRILDIERCKVLVISTSGYRGSESQKAASQRGGGRA